ncbi:hypothetical protein PIB30_042574 [Stylosanthes scabra]|uniref:Retrotransposon Copia-like N-terminal domain-containing protein n=1 Tax=Stylosanthes scabra TaxID=79078 RepID=A0ABU6QG14_9FABA|nr:hypothetical protein [Stylosanthes scabra]
MADQDEEVENPVNSQNQNQSFSASDLQSLARLMNQLAVLQSQTARTVLNHIQDPISPYYLHPNESPSLTLTQTPLTTRNYHSWARSVSLSIKSKNKLPSLMEVSQNQKEHI